MYIIKYEVYLIENQAFRGNGKEVIGYRETV